MKKIILAMFALAFTLVISGCGDSKLDEIKTTFISECTSGGLPKSVCACSFDKISDKYSEKQIIALETDSAPEGFEMFMLETMMSCAQ